ncbi:MAG: TIGR03618 family F420-dependent PPOX class oxidoreductase [Acidimicrobiia bacterium]
MATMSDDERDAFLQERRVGVLAMGRDGAGPLLAPIWYRYEPGAGFEILMGGSTAKAARLRAEGRASICVQDEGRPYRYVTVEGAVTVESLGGLEAARPAIEQMASRYLGSAAGAAYAKAFRTPDEVIVRLTPERWRTEVLG